LFVPHKQETEAT